MSAPSGQLQGTPPAIDVSFRVEEADQTRATIAYFLAKAPLSVFFIAMFVLGQTVRIAFDIAQDEITSTTVIMPALLAVFLVCVLYLPRRAVRKLTEAERQVRFLMNEQCVEVIGGVSQSRIGWESVTGIGVSRQGLLVHVKIGPGLFVARQHLSATDFETLKQWARWRPAKRSGALKAVLILWVVLVLMFVAIYNLVSTP